MPYTNTYFRWIITSVIALLFLTSNCFAANNYWIGVTSVDWNTGSNWSLGTVPASGDAVYIGTTALTPYLPTIAAGNANSCTSVTLGTFGVLNDAITLTVNGTLTVSGTITQNPNTVLGNVTTTLAGSGAITCAAIQTGNSTTFLNLGLTILTSDNLQLVSTVNVLHVTGNVTVNSTAFFVTVLFVVLDLENNNATFSVQGGTTIIDGQIVTTNTNGGVILGSNPSPTSTAKFSIDMPSGSSQTPVVKLTGATPINSSSLTGSVDFYNNTGGTGTCTVIYAGTSTQTVYTESSTLINIVPSAYQNVSFSSTGTKSIQSGNLSVWGNWTSASGKVDAVTNTPSVIFEGTTQTLSDTSSNSGAGVVFENVYFQGGGTKTINTGNFSVASTGVLTMAGSSKLNANGDLILVSDSLSSASVAPIPSGSSIAGNVNVQRFIFGSWTNLNKRGYRIISSAVYTGQVTTPANRNVFDLTYLLNSTYIAGPSGGGFNSPNGTNPTIYLFREDIVPSDAGFTAGNWKGLDKINNTPVYNIGTQARLTTASVADTTVTLPVGTGVLFYFIGNKTNNTSQSGSKTSYPFDYPESVVFTQLGLLNAGTINVKLWYRSDSLLSYSNVTGNSGIRGYCLVGNPYASTINWEKFNRNGTLSSSTIYGANFPAASTTPTTIWLFDPLTRQYDAYQQKTGTVDTVSVRPSSSYTGAASNMIASGQGFFIRASGSTQSLSFRESAKTTSQPRVGDLDSLFNAIPPSTATVQAENPSLRFRLIKDSINTDEIVISFADNASLNFNEAWDAEDLGGLGADVSLSSLSADNVNLAINTVPLPVGSSLKIPLLVSATSSGSYSLSLVNLEGLTENYQVYLIDNYKKDSLDMRSYLTYNFNIDLTDTTSFGTKRFSIVIRDNPAMLTKVTSINAVKQSNSGNISWKTNNAYDETVFNLERSSDNGKTFTVLTTVNSNSSGSYDYVDHSPALGINIYRLSYAIGADQEYSNTASLDFSVNASLAVSLYPNPTTSLINVKINNNSSDDYTITLMNSDGSVMNKASAMQTSWQYNASALLPGAYIISVYDNKVNMPVGVSKFIKQ